MMKIAKTMTKILLMLLAALTAFLAAVYIHHVVRLDQEAELRTPLGEMVEVGGHRMSVYTRGHGGRTLVFMSGGGTCSPVLDFRSLYSALTDDFTIAVIEKFGYGFSDVVDRPRDIASILEDTRTALAKAGIGGPYVLCPHSMSGIEALYWAQQFPEEVEAIIGLDMAVPQAYEDYRISMPMLRISQFAARIGLIRLLPGIAESDAMKYGTLTDAEKEIYKAVFYDKTATETMLNEVACIKENAAAVRKNGMPQLPMLLFVSNGEGTGWDQDTWRGYQEDFISRAENGRLIRLDCPHYVHDHAYERISEEIRAFLAQTDDGNR